MDNFNLNVYVEQINHEADSTILNKWEENEELALNNVIDPNTEFKSICSAENKTLVTPSNSYGFIGDPRVPETKKLVTELQLLEQRSLKRELIQQFQSDCLNRELEDTLEGFKSQRARSVSDSSLVAKVHAYTSTHLSTPEEISCQTMDSSVSSSMDTKTSAQVGPCNKLLKYPPERITVTTEKCSYLTDSPNRARSSRLGHDALDKDRDLLEGTGSQLSAASSHESIATASISSGLLHRKNSLVSTHSLGNMASESSCRLDRSMTTADQLAWEFRRARDRLDTASNISGCSSRFELESNYSERAETMSTISDVSGYEEEMFRIKRLLLLDSTPPSGKYETVKEQNFTQITGKPSSLMSPKTNVDLEIHSLTVQLQNALAEKEKYRIEAMAAETNVALEWQEKYQEVLRQKAHMKGRLETIQSEMETLVSGQKEVVNHAKTLEKELKLKTAADDEAALQEIEKLLSEINRLQHGLRETHTRNQDLTVQLELRASEISQWKEEVQKTEDANEKLRIEFQELKVEAESKDGAIQGLKDKISDQHVEFQSLLQTKLKAENNMSSLKNEIESAKKSGHWYRDQLHACQAAKVKVQQQLMGSQTNVVSQGHQIERMKGEISTLHQLVEETQHRAVREKEALMRKLEVIQADMLEREATIFSQINNDSTADTINTITTKLKRIEREKTKMLSLSETAVQDHKEEITSLKSALQAKDLALDVSNTENSRLMVKATTLQKTLNDKELALQVLENKYKNIDMSHSHLAENIKSKEHTLLELKNEKVAVEVALAAAGREKTEVDEAISTLRDDFARLSTSYQTMKTELREKEKCILNLKVDVNELQRFKQIQAEKISALEKTGEDYRDLQRQISQTEALEQRVEQLSKVNKELNLKINELSEAHSYVKEQMSKMEETIAAREEQLLNQTRNFEVHSEELKVKEESLVQLQNEKAAQEEYATKLQVKITELETFNRRLEVEVASVKKQLINANGAIEQFNLLCRKSEEEKHDLENQMKKLVKELETSKSSQSAKLNGSVVVTELESPDAMPVIQKTLSSHENGCVQLNLQHLYALMGNTESRVLLLLSPEQSELRSRVQKEQAHVVNSTNDIDALYSKLLNVNDSVTKALECRNQLAAEIQREKQSSETVRNELFDMKHRMFVKPSPGQQNRNYISYSTQTDDVCVGDAGIQTMNDDISNYREQIDLLQKEISKLKGSLKLNEIEHREKHRKYESNIRTLLKKVKEHMRGRKVSERALEELRRKTEDGGELVTLKCEVGKLEAELEASEKKYEKQKKIAVETQEAMLELEREKGQLVQRRSISKEKVFTMSEDRDIVVTSGFDQKARQLQLIQFQTRVTELEEEVRKSHIIIKELRKEIFSEKCETSQLRKQLSSLRMGLETANDMLDTKKVELGRTESMCYVLRTNISHLKKQLETEQQAHEECKQEVEILRENLEETRAKDPVLADQIKTLSYHLHQKSQEVTGLHEKIRLTEERWLATEHGMQRSTSALQDELCTLRAELDSVRGDKFTFQTQAAELRAALHSNVEQNKVLRLKLETYGCESKDKLPDLTSSLPLPPTKYDETRIAELLQQSTILPHNKPLNNLQCCLDSLKQEMATLQRQLTAKTAQDERGTEMKPECSGVKDV